MDRLQQSFTVVVVLATIVAAVAFGVSATPSSSLVVTDADTGEQLLYVPVEDDDEITLSYTHSVEKTPVKDIYVVDDSALRADRMVFHSHGAGLPSGSAIEQTEEGFVVRSNESYETLSVVPGSIAGHELVIDDDRYDLVEKSDGPVHLTVTDRSLRDRTIGDRFVSTDNSHEPHLSNSYWDPSIERHGVELRGSNGPSVPTHSLHSQLS